MLHREFECWTLIESSKFSGRILETFFVAQDCISSLCVHTPSSALFVAQLIITVFICGSPCAGWRKPQKVRLHQSKSLLGCTTPTAGVACLGCITWIGDRKSEFPYFLLNYLLWVSNLAILRRSGVVGFFFPISIFFSPLFTELFSGCVDSSVLSRRPIQRDAAFTARKIQFFKCNWSGENVICALQLTTVEQLNIVNHGAVLISPSVMQTNSLEKRRFMWTQDKCS